MLIKYSKKILRDPLLLFVIVGVFIFIVYHWLEDNYLPRVDLSSAARLQLVEEYRAITGLKASPEVITRLEKSYITGELLFREAIDSGMHLIDPGTRASLIEKMRFRISALIPEPSDPELVNYYAQNMQRYYTEPLLSFEHVFFIKLPSNAEILAEKLQSGELLKGDRFVHGNRFVDISEGMLRGIFGEQFLTALRSLESTQWEGPFRSNYGSHYVRVESKTLAQPMPFALVKNMLVNDLMQIRIDQAIASKIQLLEAQYEINVEP